MKLRKFLCKYNFHSWSYFRMSSVYMESFPESGGWGRECVYCDRLEYLDDDKNEWQCGIRGVIRNEG